MTVLLLQCMSLQLALRFISLPCSKQVAFGQKQTSNGMRSPQSVANDPNVWSGRAMQGDFE